MVGDASVPLWGEISRMFLQQETLYLLGGMVVLNIILMFLRGAERTTYRDTRRQGAASDCLYILAAGEAEAVVEAPGGERKRLAVLEPGRVFGEMGLMTGSPRQSGLETVQNEIAGDKGGSWGQHEILERIRRLFSLAHR